MDRSLQIVTGGRARCVAATWNTRDTWSDVMKFYAPVSGSAWIELGERRTHLTPGRCYVIPAHARLSYAATPTLLIDYLHFSPHSPSIEAQVTSAGRIHLLAPEFGRRWRSTCRSIKGLDLNGANAQSFHIHGLLLDALGYALAASNAQTDTLEMPHISRLLPALHYMDDHVMAPPPLADLAARVHCSPEHFHRLFVSCFATTPFVYLLRRRLARAHQLLAGGSMTVKETASECGYHDPGYFSRVFHQHYGYRPRDVLTGTIPSHP